MAHTEVLNAAALLDNLAQGRAGAPSDEFFASDHGLQVHPGGWEQVVTTTQPTFLACFWLKTGVFPVFWCNRLPTNSAMEAEKEMLEVDQKFLSGLVPFNRPAARSTVFSTSGVALFEDPEVAYA